MPKTIPSPTLIEAAGTKPKRIEEYVGLVNTNDANISVAKMTSPCGWIEPGQRPRFREITLVLHGELQVEQEDGAVMTLAAGQAIVTEPGEWIRYSTPHPEGAEYVAICTPAFSPETVHRDGT